MAKKTTKKAIIIFVILLFILATWGVVVLYLFPTQAPNDFVESDTVTVNSEDLWEANTSITVEEEANAVTQWQIRTSLTILEE